MSNYYPRTMSKCKFVVYDEFIMEYSANLIQTNAKSALWFGANVVTHFIIAACQGIQVHTLTLFNLERAGSEKNHAPLSCFFQYVSVCFSGTCAQRVIFSVTLPVLSKLKSVIVKKVLLER